MPLILRVVTCPLRGCMQRNMYTMHQQIKTEVVLTFEHAVVCDLAKYFFYPTPVAIKHSRIHLGTCTSHHQGAGGGTARTTCACAA